MKVEEIGQRYREKCEEIVNLDGEKDKKKLRKLERERKRLRKEFFKKSLNVGRDSFSIKSKYWVGFLELWFTITIIGAFYFLIYMLNLGNPDGFFGYVFDKINFMGLGK